jgi:hypothetical protein
MLISMAWYEWIVQLLNFRFPDTIVVKSEIVKKGHESG